MASRISVVVLAVCALLSVPSSAAHADTERRIALIIGNDSYKSLKHLDNGVNDARAMAAELKAAGFETVLKTNAGRKEMHNAIDEFGGKLASGSVGLFYYAGHGIQAGDKNFLIPVDADLQSAADLVADAIDTGRVMQAMEAAHNRLNIVILDACRDNPLPKGGRSGSRGLAVIPAPTGTFVAYATGPGKIAQDGDRGGNGVYTGELVKALREPGLRIEDVFKKTGNAVMEKTGGKQVPWTQASSLQGDFYFRPASTAAPVVRNDGGGAGGNQAEIVFWQSIQGSSRASDLDAYLRQFPNGTFAALARSRLDDLKGAKAASLSSPRPDPVLEVLDREMVVVRKGSVRESPDAKAKVLVTLKDGDAIQVTGKVKGENWYAVSRKGRSIGYMVTDTLEEPGAYKMRKEKEPQLATASLPSPAPIQMGAASLPKTPSIGRTIRYSGRGLAGRFDQKKTVISTSGAGDVTYSVVMTGTGDLKYVESSNPFVGNLRVVSGADMDLVTTITEGNPDSIFPLRVGNKVAWSTRLSYVTPSTGARRLAERVSNILCSVDGVEREKSSIGEVDVFVVNCTHKYGDLIARNTHKYSPKYEIIVYSRIENFFGEQIVPGDSAVVAIGN